MLNAEREDEMSDWKALAEKELRGKGISEIEWETLEGIRVKPLYTEEDTASLNHLGSLPGFAPFTRGVNPGREPRWFRLAVSSSV